MTDLNIGWNDTNGLVALGNIPNIGPIPVFVINFVAIMYVFYPQG